MNSRKAEEVLRGVIRLFSEKQFPETCAKAFIAAPEVPSSSWSLGNQILMLSSGTSDARGYRQWNKVYRNVRRGAKAVYILVPMKRNTTDEKTGEEKTVTVGFGAVPVFRYEDTEGMPLEQYQPKRLPPLFGLAERNGISVQWANSRHGEYGSIDLAGDTITLSTESADTYLHELVHWYDNKNQKLKAGQDSKQETVAQLGACVLASMYGHDARQYTWSYISSYSGTDSPQKIGQTCMRVLSRVQKVINAIIADAQELEGQNAT